MGVHPSTHAAYALTWLSLSALGLLMTRRRFAKRL
jgi:hypothetical protein